MENQKQYCFFCGRGYYSDDPEFDTKRKLCEHCAEELDKDNPYINYMSEPNKNSGNKQYPRSGDSSPSRTELHT